MSDKQYICVAGIVQFEPTVRLAGGKEVRDVKIRVANSEKTMSATVWSDDYGHVSINKGDYIVVEGAYTMRPGQDKHGQAVTYHNLAASMLAVIPGAERRGGSVSTASSAPAPVETPAGGDDLPF